MSTEFSIHDHRHQLKQLRDAGTTALWDNRKALSCPVCEEPFDRLIVTKQRETMLPETDGARCCLLNQDDALYVFRH